MNTMLNVLKSELVPRFFIAQGEDSFPVKRLWIMPARGSDPNLLLPWRCRRVPDGRQKAQKFEDEYLDDLFLYVKELGFEALLHAFA